MTTFVTMRDEAVRQIAAAFPQKVKVAAHPGLFTEAEIRRLANQTPAVLTSFMRYREDGHLVDFISWVLYRADSKDRLYDGALQMVSALIPVIKGIDAEWTIGGGERIEAECLYSGALDNLNVTLWAVRWSLHIQETVFEGGAGGIPELDLDTFEGYEAAHRVGGEVVKDNITLEGKDGDTV
jgi:hypothetical protein